MSEFGIGRERRRRKGGEDAAYIYLLPVCNTYRSRIKGYQPFNNGGVSFCLLPSFEKKKRFLATGFEPRASNLIFRVEKRGKNTGPDVGLITEHYLSICGCGPTTPLDLC